MNRWIEMDKAEVKRAWEKLIESLSLFTQPGLSLYTHLYETTQVSTLLLHLSVDYTHLYETTQFAIRFVPLLSIELVLVERSTFQHSRFSNSFSPTVCKVPTRRRQGRIVTYSILPSCQSRFVSYTSSRKGDFLTFRRVPHL